MEIVIQGEAKEIAALLREIAERREDACLVEADVLAQSLGKIFSRTPDRNSFREQSTAQWCKPSTTLDS